MREVFVDSMTKGLRKGGSTTDADTDSAIDGRQTESKGRVEGRGGIGVLRTSWGKKRGKEKKK